MIPREFLKEKRGIVLTLPVNRLLNTSINQMIRENQFYGLELEDIIDELTFGKMYMDNFYETLKIKIYHESFSIVLEGCIYPEYLIKG